MSLAHLRGLKRIGVLATLALALTLLAASEASADTIVVTADGALVWNRPSGVSFVLTQLPKGTKLDVLRRAGDWYEVLLPRGATAERTGFIRASQVAVDSVGPMSAAAKQAAAETSGGSTKVRARPVFLNIDITYRRGSDDLIRTSTAFSDTYAENGSLASNYGNGSGYQFDVMGSQVVWGQIGVGIGVSYYQRAGTTRVEASVPHPFFFNQPRSATFETKAPEGTEVALHIPIVWMPASGMRVKILVFGGPSIFRVTQHVVHDVSLDDPYPHDTVTITGVTTTKLESTQPGFHVGGDVAYFFSRSLGVGAGVRYSSSATIALKDDAATTEGKAGGTQIVAGLRVRF